MALKENGGPNPDFPESTNISSAYVIFVMFSIYKTQHTNTRNGVFPDERKYTNGTPTRRNMRLCCT
jgi:hypothetical protein